MVESSPSRQRRPPYKTTKGKTDEAADAAVLTYLLTLPRAKPFANVPCKISELVTRRNCNLSVTPIAIRATGFLGHAPETLVSLMALFPSARRNMYTSLFLASSLTSRNRFFIAVAAGDSLPPHTAALLSNGVQERCFCFCNAKKTTAAVGASLALHCRLIDTSLTLQGKQQQTFETSSGWRSKCSMSPVTSNSSAAPHTSSLSLSLSSLLQFLSLSSSSHSAGEEQFRHHK